ncbi:MAG: isoleucine--tRNA ligase, partial [Clostridia bacterium]|nr:isoleucine--tRNA ligase [Clostridia bacterium]
TPLIYYARESWFIKMTEVKDDLIKNNNTINWIPESIGKGRFGDWLENVQDWGISRNRYWGTPLNIWECECGHRHSIGSIAELKEMSDNCPDEIELHRPYIDAVTIKCEKCGKQMKRVPEVIDCWFDSGSMPFAQHHYPFENEDLFKSQFPADFISEAVDQTRGWFYSLLAISTLVFNKAPFKNVIVLGHVQDENGQKMSKSKGNAVDPFDALETYGADAIRWYFYTNSAPWLPSRFSGKAVVEGQRKFMGTLWNTYAFFVLYANIGNFDASKYEIDYSSLSVMDKWLLSKLNSMVKGVDENLANYMIPEAAKTLSEFVDEMSNWYVRRCRERYWSQELTKDKINAYMTLYTALVTTAKAAAPMIPFMAEDIYQNLVRSLDSSAPESVHLCAFPEVREEFIDKDLESNMENVLLAVTLGRAARNGANIKNRQPLGKIYIKCDTQLDKFYTDIIKEELNIKELEYIDDAESLVSYSFKPQMRTLGPKYGKYLNEIRTILAGIDGSKAMASLKNDGVLKLELSDITAELAQEDLLIDAKQKEGYFTLSDMGMTVTLDTSLTPELIEEGFVREIVSKIQTMRKDADFDVMDHIIVSIEANEKIFEIASRNRQSIMTDVLAEDILSGAMDGAESTAEWNINSEKAVFHVKRTK